MQSFLKRIVRFLAFFVIKLQLVGRENLPEQGPYLLVTNHIAALDTPIMFMLVPHKARCFAASKHRRNPVYGPLLALGNPIWIKRGEVDRDALREALKTLKDGYPLGLAPEGTRSRGPYALQPAKTGAAYLATRADVPILPAGIIGTEKIKDNFPLRRTPVRIVFGKPFRLPANGRVRGPLLDEYTDLIMREIAALLPEEYRGVYA